MAVGFEKLQVGQEYDRPFLADLWGYKGFQAISRGVITPSGKNFIILFVTKEKQKSLTQYRDYINDNNLHWEGEEKHTSDSRVINAESAKDEIHLFYREIHHSPFVYHGKIFLKEYKILTDRPSKFLFSIGKSVALPDLFDDIELHQQEYRTLEKTEQKSIVKSRIGQGIFRDRLIETWGSCSVTGLSNITLLRASHVKPWRDSSNRERMDPMNGLLLHPTLDHLFDSGFITFDDDGLILISEKLSKEEIEILYLSDNLKLRKLPDGLRKYMRFHRQNIFKNG